MSNIFTQSITPPFTKQSVSEFFVDPMFMGEDIRGAITVRTDIKGTEKLNRISRPSMITKKKTLPGFTPNGSFELTTQDITVQPMAIEFEQNGREFWGSVMQQMLDSGYKEDDVEQMKSPDVWNKIVLPIIAQAGQKDLIRQMWFNNPNSADENYNGYTGFFHHFINDLNSGVIPASQHITAPYGAFTHSAVDITLEITGNATGSFGVELIVGNNTYNYHSTVGVGETAADAMAKFYDDNQAQASIDGFTLTNLGGGTLTIKRNDYASFSITGSADTGLALIVSNEFSAGNPIDSTDLAYSLLEQMIDAMPPEMLELNPVFNVTRQLYRNLLKTWKALGTETANDIQFNGIRVPSYEGIPILMRPDWDLWNSALNQGKPWRAILTPQKNLLFATDGSADSELIETWYNQDEQMRRYRVQYKAQTAYLHSELIVLAGLV